MADAVLEALLARAGEEDRVRDVGLLRHERPPLGEMRRRFAAA
jgi:hypothetical protein